MYELQPHTEQPHTSPSSPGQIGSGAASRPYSGETYYDRPALKPGHYRWLIAGYFWVGGLAGACALLALIVDLVGSADDRIIVRLGRYFALAGAVIGPVLLIADLLTPQRFLNMLRIFRRTSPMSQGAWALALFGVFSGLAVAAQLAEDLAGAGWAVGFGRVVSVPSAVLGAFIAYYTATLLAATSVPLWAAAPRLLTALFAASACSIGAAALTLGGILAGAEVGVTKRLEVFDLVCGVAEAALLAGVWVQWRSRRVDGPLWQWPYAAALVGGVVVLGLLGPLSVHAWQLFAGSSSEPLSVGAALARLAGGFLLRAVVLFAGRPSALRPRDYFHFTQAAEGGGNTRWANS